MRDGRRAAIGAHSRDVDLLVLVLVEIALHKLLEVPEPHLPRLALLELHLVEAGLAQLVLDILLEPVVEESAPAKTSRANSRLLDTDGV